MIKNFLRREAKMLIVLLIPFMYMMIMWNTMPDQVPIHRNIRGEADGYGPRYVLPLMNIGVYLLLLFLPKIDPRKKNYETFSWSYKKIRFSIIIFFAAITMIEFVAASGVTMDIPRIIAVGVSLLFAVLGNYMGTLKPNWFIGIRTPWTMESEEVWRRTHAFGGKLFFWGGLLGAMTAMILPSEAVLIILAVIIGIIAIVPIVYSFILFRSIRKNSV